VTIGRAAPAAVVASLLAVASAAAEAPAWTIDAAASRIAFTGRQMQVPARGVFERFVAEVRFDPDDLAASRIAVEIDPASAKTGVADVDRELRRAKWFDVAQFPTARFAATTIRRVAPDRYEAAGTLTIRDATVPVVLPFTLALQPDPARPGGRTATARGAVTVKRSAFGVGQAEWRDTNIVADDVTLEITLVARTP